MGGMSVQSEDDREPTDAEVLVTNPERDHWRRIVEAQRKDIRDLVRQLEDASRRAAFWETMADCCVTPPEVDQ